MSILQISPDKEKAKVFLDRAEGATKVLHTIIKIENPDIPFILHTEYDIFHMLSIAILAFDGEKIQDKDHHKALLARIVEKYSSQLSPSHAYVLDELRKIRNDINYYGEKDTAVLQDFYERNKKSLDSLRSHLFGLIREKLCSK